MAFLHAQNLSKTYPGRVPVHALVDVSLEVNAGEYLAITGPSGSGKSTLLNELALLDAPSSGEYFIDQRPTRALPDKTRAQIRSNTFAFVFQSFHLLSGRTVRSNVALGSLYRGLPQKQRLEIADEALASVGLTHKAHQKVENLSGGERQRVAIARAIASGAPVLVADEPTGNLDSASAEMVMDTIENLNSTGTTTIVVTHDSDIAKRAHRQVRVRDGHVDADPPTLQDHHGAPNTPPVKGTPSTIRTWDALTDAWQGLWSKPGRTLSLVAAVALGVALALTTIGLSQTANSQVSELFDALRNQRVALTSQTFSNEDSLTSGIKTPSNPLTQPQALLRLQQLGGVEAAAILSSHQELPVATTPGVNNPHGITTQVFGLVGGEIPPTLFTTSTDTPEIPVEALNNNEVIIGANLAAQLELGPLLAAPNVWIEGQPYQVAGILTDSGLHNEILSAILLTEETATHLSQPNYAMAEIRVAPGAAARIAQQGPIAWSPNDPESITVDAPPDPTSMRDQIESNVAAILITLTAVALLAAILSLTTSMTSSIYQRRGEFGLRRAIGAKRSHITALVLSEATFIGLIGGIIGSYTSIITILTITLIKHWQPVFDPTLIPLGIAGGILVGILGGLIAATKASHIQPTQALHS